MLRYGAIVPGRVTFREQQASRGYIAPHLQGGRIRDATPL
jgi:hypothetical protein